MEGELLGSEKPSAQEKSFTEIFDKQLPFYIAIGMPPAEYWDGSPELAQYYRKAYLIKQELKDHDAWRQGMYFYDALSVSLDHVLSKNSQAEYPKMPYMQSQKAKNKAKAEADKVREAKAQAEIWMRSLVNRYKNIEP